MNTQYEQHRSITSLPKKLLQPIRFALKLRLLLKDRGLEYKKADKTSGFNEGRMEDICSGKNIPLAADWNTMLVRLKINPAVFEPEDFIERGW
jgi:hypothetical protein